MGTKGSVFMLWAHFIVAFAQTGALASAAIPHYTAVPGEREFSGEMIVRPVQAAAWIDRGLSPKDAAARVAAARARLAGLPVREHVAATDEYIVRVPAGRDENGLAAELMSDGLFQYVEPNWIVFPLACPNDARLTSQWHHNSDHMDSCAGWSLYNGDASVTVAICDTGVRTTHDDLRHRRAEGYNAVDRLWESQGGQINDINGHGTATTGCAAANGNDGVGVVGVGWYLTHRMVRVSNLGSGNASLSDLQHGARTAIENGDRVASVSYSGVDNASNLTTATYIKSIGGLLVWAAGNDNRNLTFGNRDADDLIVAGATEEGDGKAGFSAYGQFVDVMAPGVFVYTCTNNGDTAYDYVSGTSFSTPLTAGLCALLFSADPSLTPDEVELLLKSGCDDLGQNGVDNTYAYGRINVHNSLADLNNCSPGTITQQPLSQAICLGDGAQLAVGTSIANPTYQWRRDGQKLADDGRISGAQSPTLTLSYSVAADAGSYDCVIVNAATGCPTMTATALLTVDLCGRLTSLERVDTAPTGGADFATFHRNSTHFTFDLRIDTTQIPSDWNASEFALDVVAPALGRIWHASDELTVPTDNLSVPLLPESSADTRVFDTFVTVPGPAFQTPATLASPGGVVSTDVKIRGISGQGNEIPLAWFDTPADPAGTNFVGARISFELFAPGNLTLAPEGELFATLTGRTSAVGFPTGDNFSFAIYRSDPACPEDLNGDQLVDLGDLSILLANFGTTGADPGDGDIDADGDVDLGDLSLLLVRFGLPCA